MRYARIISLIIGTESLMSSGVASRSALYDASASWRNVVPAGRSRRRCGSASPFEELLERVYEAEHGRGVETVLRGPRHFYEGIVCPEYQRISIKEEKAFVGHFLYWCESYISSRRSENRGHESERAKFAYAASPSLRRKAGSAASLSTASPRSCTLPGGYD